MKTKALVCAAVIFIISLACNLPVSDSPPASPSQPGQAGSTAVQPPPATLPPAAAPTQQPTQVYPTQEPTPTFPPADVTFTINCTALDPSFKPACDAYIAATRDRSYPLLRQITGVSLSDCYQNINYTILPDDPGKGAGGFSNGPEITYNKTYSIELIHQYDTHELLHSISTCSGALDEHVFHGIIPNAVYARLGVFDAGYFTSSSNLKELNTYLLEKIKTASGEERNDMCRGIFNNELTLAYFQFDKDKAPAAINALYRATINPQPATPPNAVLTSIWNGHAAQVQVLLETLEQQYKVPINVPECGY
jgi:hypothetical protein